MFLSYHLAYCFSSFSSSQITTFSLSKLTFLHHYCLCFDTQSMEYNSRTENILKLHGCSATTVLYNHSIHQSLYFNKSMPLAYMWPAWCMIFLSNRNKHSQANLLYHRKVPPSFPCFEFSKFSIPLLHYHLILYTLINYHLKVVQHQLLMKTCNDLPLFTCSH